MRTAVVLLLAAGSAAQDTPQSTVDCTTCQNYFDGCNNCQCTDGVAMCSKMACKTMGTPKCNDAPATPVPSQDICAMVRCAVTMCPDGTRAPPPAGATGAAACCGGDVTLCPKPVDVCATVRCMQVLCADGTQAPKNKNATGAAACCGDVALCKKPTCGENEVYMQYAGCDSCMVRNPPKDQPRHPCDPYPMAGCQCASGFAKNGASCVPYDQCPTSAPMPSSPFDCKTCPSGYNDGCNNCMCGKDDVASCTEMYCFVQGTPKCNGEDQQQIMRKSAESVKQDKPSACPLTGLSMPSHSDNGKKVGHVMAAVFVPLGAIGLITVVVAAVAKWRRGKATAANENEPSTDALVEL